VRVGVFVIPAPQVEAHENNWAGVGGYRRLPDDDPWQGRNTFSYILTKVQSHNKTTLLLV
jgi:hypothetical protein